MDLSKADTVFGPKEVVRAGKGKGPIRSAFVDKVTAHVLPRGSSDETRLNFGLVLMMLGASNNKSLGAWKQYVATYSLLMFPSLQEKIASPGIVFRELSATEVQLIVGVAEDLRKSLENEETDSISALQARIEGKAIVAGLPEVPKDRDWMSVHGEWIPKVLACHYSLVLFLAGKRVDGSDHTSITVKRPRALRDKAHLGESVSFLDGPLRLSDSSHLILNNAWSEMSSLRATCITEFSGFSASDTDFIQDIVYTTMHLLQFSGMQHAKITHGFLKAYEWVVEVPALRNSLGLYIGSIKAMAKYPGEIQPYLKVIYGDKIDVFPRKELEPLVACAVAVGREVNDNMKDFFSSGEYSAIVEAFLDEREKRKTIREGKIIKEEQEFLELFTPDESNLEE